MKKMAWITGGLVCLMVLLAVLGSAFGAVVNIATDETFYAGQSRAAVMQMLGAQGDGDVSAQVTDYIGMDSAAQKAFAKETVAFMKGETDAQPDVLNEKEKQHMLDVRAIVQSMANMSRAYLTIAAALAVVAAWTGAKLKGRVKPVAVGMLTAVTLIMLVVKNVIDEIAAGGFESVFVQMHEMLFENDLWLMNPQTDILIRMMPQQLFEQALVNGASMALRMAFIVLFMLFAVQGIFGNMIRRHLAKGERK